MKAGARVDGLDGAWDLEQTSSFLLVASTLLDLKSARLLPQGESRTRRTSRCSRRATCSSPGCCSTARSSRSPPCSSSGWLGSRGAIPRAVGPGGAVRRTAPGGADRDRARRVRRAGRQGAGAQARARGVAPAHPRPGRVGARAGRARGRAAAPYRHDDLPGAVRRRPGHPDHGGAVPGAAGAVPRERRRLRPGVPAGRADACAGPAERRRRRGRPPDRRVRGRRRSHRAGQPTDETRGPPTEETA